MAKKRTHTKNTDKDIYTAFRPLFYLSKALGLAPYQLKLDNGTVRTSKLDIAWTVVITCIHAAGLLRLPITRTRYSNPGEIISNLSYEFLLHVSAIMTTVQLAIPSGHSLPSILHQIHMIDCNLYPRSETNRSYAGSHKGLCYLIMCLMIVIVTMAFSSKPQVSDLLIYVLYRAGKGLSILCVGVAVLQFVTLAHFIKQKYSMIKTELLCFRCDKPTHSYNTMNVHNHGETISVIDLSNRNPHEMNINRDRLRKLNSVCPITEQQSKKHTYRLRNNGENVARHFGIRNTRENMSNHLHGIRNGENMLNNFHGVRNNRENMSNNLHGVHNNRENMSNNLHGIHNSENISNNLHVVRNNRENVSRNLQGVRNNRENMTEHHIIRNNEENLSNNRHGVLSIRENMLNNLHGLGINRENIPHNHQGVRNRENMSNNLHGVRNNRENMLEHHGLHNTDSMTEHLHDIGNNRQNMSNNIHDMCNRENMTEYHSVHNHENMTEHLHGIHNNGESITENLHDIQNNRRNITEHLHGIHNRENMTEHIPDVHNRENIAEHLHGIRNIGESITENLHDIQNTRRNITEHLHGIHNKENIAEHIHGIRNNGNASNHMKIHRNDKNLAKHSNFNNNHEHHPMKYNQICCVTSGRRIRQLRIAYSQLHDTIDLLYKNFAVVILFGFTLETINFITDLYHGVCTIRSIKTMDYYLFTRMVAYYLWNLTFIIFPIYPCQGIYKEIQGISTSLQKCLLSSGKVHQLHAFFWQVKYASVELSALGFFEMNYHTLYSLLGVTVSYLLILNQF